MEAAYAWTEDVYRLQDNIGQAIGVQKSIEKKLKKNGDLQAYNAEVQKLIDKKHITELTAEEEDKCKDLPVSYISHHAERAT